MVSAALEVFAADVALGGTWGPCWSSCWGRRWPCPTAACSSSSLASSAFFFYFLSCDHLWEPAPLMMCSDFQSQDSLAVATSDCLRSEWLHTNSIQPSLFCTGQTPPHPPPPHLEPLAALDLPRPPHCLSHSAQLSPLQVLLWSSHLCLLESLLLSLLHPPSAQGTLQCHSHTRIQCRRSQTAKILRRQKCLIRGGPPLVITNVRRKYKNTQSYLLISLTIRDTWSKIWECPDRGTMSTIN